MVTFLIVIALVAGVAGLASLSQATLGVGVIAFGCLLGILARIAQASSHKTETDRTVAEARPNEHRKELSPVEAPRQGDNKDITQQLIDAAKQRR